MIIKVVELCRVSPYEDGKTEGLRTVTYDSPQETMLKAFTDYEENFNSDNIVESEDDFDGACLDSQTIKVSMLT